MVEERIARLESHVEHIQADVTDIKADLRRLDDKVDGVKESVSGLRIDMEKNFGRQKVWFLLMAVGLLTVIARAFHWI